MKVLSLFDGISTGRLALERAGIDVDVYYSSEIDRNATAISQYNYPDIIRVGDVTKLDFTQFKDIDLVLSASPCQNLSVANRTRQGIHGENSNLFFKFIEALEIIRPKYFLQENVASMKNEDKLIMTEAFLKIYPDTQLIQIDSALVSAQSRKRLYWTNIPVNQPEDKGILLKDILVDVEEGNWVTDSLKTDDCVKVYDDYITALNGKRIDLQQLDEPYCLKEIRTEQGKALRRAARLEGKPDTTPRNSACKMFVPRTDRKANCLTTSCTHDAIVVIPYGEYQFVRYLTPLEWERLQTMPDNYTKYGLINGDTVEMTDSARYKALGNGWTCDVVSHILSGIDSQVKTITARRLF